MIKVFQISVSYLLMFFISTVQGIFVAYLIPNILGFSILISIAAIIGVVWPKNIFSRD